MDTIVKVCTGAACRKHTDLKLIKEIEKELGVKLGVYDSIRKVGFFETDCLDECADGNPIKVGSTVYSGITKEDFKKIAEGLKKQDDA